jgi:hypothetical protein
MSLAKTLYEHYCLSNLVLLTLSTFVSLYVLSKVSPSMTVSRTAVAIIGAGTQGRRLAFMVSIRP